jgi:hypothetical protein
MAAGPLGVLDRRTMFIPVPSGQLVGAPRPVNGF